MPLQWNRSYLHIFFHAYHQKTFDAGWRPCLQSVTKTVLTQLTSYGISSAVENTSTTLAAEHETVYFCWQHYVSRNCEPRCPVRLRSFYCTYTIKTSLSQFLQISPRTRHLFFVDTEKMYLRNSPQARAAGWDMWYSSDVATENSH